MPKAGFGWRPASTSRSGSQGVKIATAPLMTILSGGIVFDTPDSELASKPSPPGSRFFLFADQKAADEAAEPVRVYYRLLFPGSMRGVDVGTPVELRGQPVGQVNAVRLEYDPKSDTIRVPVTIEVAPHRIKVGGEHLDLTATDPVVATNRMFAELIAKGLRAQLVSASLLTGQQVISLDFVADAPPAQLVQRRALPRTADGRGERHRTDRRFGESADEQARRTAARPAGGPDPQYGRPCRRPRRQPRCKALAAQSRSDLGQHRKADADRGCSGRAAAAAARTAPPSNCAAH